MKIEIINGQLPERANEGDAGYDIHASENGMIPVGSFLLVPCGFKMELEPGMEAQIRPRSGLALKKQIVVLNSPGTIDSGYRGEVKVLLANMGSAPFYYEKGDRIAQMVFAKYETPKLEEGKILEKTSRGEKGFGSTGVKKSEG